MDKFVQINYNNIEENEEYDKIINLVIKNCFQKEKLDNLKIYINIVLTNKDEIRKINKKFRNIDKVTDVLSFPMFEKQELEELIKKQENIVTNILGDVVICVPKVYEQAEEYNHTFERELSYMLVHGFYHLMGYDHMEKQEKDIMRKKEEDILKNLNITR